MDMATRVLSGEPIGRAVGDMGMDAYMAAAGRVMDIRTHWNGLWDAVPVEPGTKTERGGFTRELPLVSPPRIGITGWWQVNDRLAALVLPNSLVPELFEVFPLVLTDDGRLTFTGMVGEGSADGETWDVTVYAYLPEGALDVEQESLGAKLIHSLVGVILLACSIAQGDPKVIKHTPVPPKARVKGGKTVAPRSRDTIHLPALRYDTEHGSVVAKSSTGEVVWHRVRGHWRRLTSDRFTVKKGQRIWIHPHTKGDPAKGQSGGKYAL